MRGSLAVARPRLSGLQVLSPPVATPLAFRALANNCTGETPLPPRRTCCSLHMLPFCFRRTAAPRLYFAAPAPSTSMASTGIGFAFTSQHRQCGRNELWARTAFGGALGGLPSRSKEPAEPAVGESCQCVELPSLPGGVERRRSQEFLVWPPTQSDEKGYFSQVRSGAHGSRPVWLFYRTSPACQRRWLRLVVRARARAVAAKLLFSLAFALASPSSCSCSKLIPPPNKQARARKSKSEKAKRQKSITEHPQN